MSTSKVSKAASKGDKGDAARSYVATGEVKKVPFGKLRPAPKELKVRQLPATKEELEALKASITAPGGGMRERMIAFEGKDGMFYVLHGNTRRDILQGLGYPAAFEIEIDVIPEPKPGAAGILAAVSTNTARAPMAWPDLAMSMGRATGTVDFSKDDARNDKKAIQDGVKSGKYVSHAAAAAEVGLSVQSIDMYAAMTACACPTVKAYDALVKIYRRGGGPTHGAAYARIPEKRRAEALAYYEKHGSFPSDIDIERKRAPGGGRKPGKKPATPPVAAPPAAAPAPASQLNLAGTGAASPVAAPPAAAPAPASQLNLAGTGTASPAAAPAPLPPSLEALREPRAQAEINRMADELALSERDVRLLDALSWLWSSGVAFDRWPRENRKALTTQIAVFNREVDGVDADEAPGE